MMPRRFPNRLFAMLILCLSAAVCATAQGPRGGGMFGNMPSVSGTVTAVSGDGLTLKGEDGVTYQVVTTTNTRMMKGMGEPFKLADLKTGDGVMAMGNLDAATKTLHAAMVFAATPEQTEQLRKARENLGKTFIAGRVTAINADDLKMTVQRSDGVSQTIGFDETTSFKRGGGRGGINIMMGGAMGGGMPGGAGASGAAQGGESITLADIKVGDNVFGTGSLKGGVFVPSQLNVSAPRAPRNPAGTPAAKPQP